MELSGFIWQVADLLRGNYRQSDYGKVILPFTILRRLDCVLEPTKAAVLAEHAKRTKEGVDPTPFLTRIAKQSFYNTSPLDLSKTLTDPSHIKANLISYVNGFSSNIGDIFEKYDFDNQIEKLASSDLLFLVAQKFAEVDLHPEVVSNADMGGVFEELIRKFAELSNETAGEHFTPREVIGLMVSLLFVEDDDAQQDEFEKTMVIQPSQRPVDKIQNARAKADEAAGGTGGAGALASGSAGSFLQGQLTNDVLLLPVGQARFAGYCSAKGRLMASFVVLKLSPEKYLLACHQDLLPSTLKRLSMFVMRAKLKLTDANAHYEMRGLLGTTADQACPALQSEVPWRAMQEGEGHFIKQHSAKNSGLIISRALWIGLKDAPSSLAFLGQSLPPATENEWQLAEVLAGISRVQAATSEAFVPQMLNYESVEGVSFKKGGYPGQEVVARSQFRGTLKRRAFIVACNSPMQAFR